MAAHAILSASASHRWLSCPPSARLCADKEDTASEYALQGTDAHTLCEYKLKKAIGMKTRNPTKSLSYYDEEMEQCAEEYATFCSSVVEEVKQTCKDPVVLIEQKLDFSQYVPEGFGTGDCVIIGDGTLHVIDYKHGKGVEFLADNNPQMMCYALGALNLFDGIYDIDKVSMTIFQPRRENVSTFEMKKKDLYSWAETVLAPTAKLAFDGEGEFKAGSHCQFCKVKAICRKRMEYNMEMAKYDFEMPATLEEAEIAVILTKADELVAWAMDVKEYALQQAVSGTHYDGFKVVEGRSNRKVLVGSRLCCEKSSKGKQSSKIGNISFLCKSGMLFSGLPSGRTLSYVKPRMGTNIFGSESVTYEGVGGTKKWERIESYGPKFVENIVQAISRDILVYAIRTLSHCFICGHVHDELIIECNKRVSLDAICEQMGRTPPWIEGILLRADGYECDFYKKD